MIKRDHKILRRNRIQQRRRLPALDLDRAAGPVIKFLQLQIRLDPHRIALKQQRFRRLALPDFPMASKRISKALLFVNKKKQKKL